MQQTLHAGASMQSLSHSLVQRGSGAAACARTRWTPYATTSTSTASTSIASTSIAQTWVPNTPASTTSSPSVTRQPPSSGSGALRADATRPSLGGAPSARETHKSRYISALVDQAVRTLSESWQPSDIPAVFTASATPRTPVPVQTASMSAIGAAGSSAPAPPPLFHRAAQLPSPMTPSTQSSPFVAPAPPPPRPAVAGADASAAGAALPPTVVPLRAFVHEVLRRSRTSAGVLQTALCYLEAVRHQIPVLAAQERLGLTRKGEATIDEFITREWDSDGDDASGSDAQPESVTAMMDDADLAATVRVDDANDTELPASPISPALRHASVAARRATATPLPTLPALPSPLLCPRRTFLAAVVLASKFTLDRSFSNKAWARLAGLPAREVGRCERALGAALGWRLWVGKLPATASATPAPVPAARALARTRTALDVLAPAVAPVPAPVPSHGIAPGHRTLGRSRTLPAGMFVDTDVTPTPLSTDHIAGPRPDPIFDALLQGSLAGMDASPSVMPTPGLSYSPASTISGGDPTRTIQMATFSDDAFASPAGVPFGSCMGVSPVCVAPSVGPPASDVAFGYKAEFASTVSPFTEQHAIRPCAPWTSTGAADNSSMTPMEFACATPSFVGRNAPWTTSTTVADFAEDVLGMPPSSAFPFGNSAPPHPDSLYQYWIS